MWHCCTCPLNGFIRTRHGPNKLGRARHAIRTTLCPHKVGTIYCSNPASAYAGVCADSQLWTCDRSVFVKYTCRCVRSSIESRPHRLEGWRVLQTFNSHRCKSRNAHVDAGFTVRVYAHIVESLAPLSVSFFASSNARLPYQVYGLSVVY